MVVVNENYKALDDVLKAWRQGDVSLDAGLEFLHLSDLTHPLCSASRQVAKAITDNGEDVDAGASPVMDEVPGMVMLSQTCDVVRSCSDRPFVEVAPLIEVPEPWVDDIRRLKRPAFAYVPVTARNHWVADLDRTMTVEKAVVARWTHTRGCENDDELRAFALALARKRSRFAFPDDFIVAAQQLQKHMINKYKKRTDEGAHLRALREIRIRAAPSWDDGQVQLSWWFVKDADPNDVAVNWPKLLDEWLALFDQTGRFNLDPPLACRLEDITARDYVESELLDLDRLSVPREPL